MKPRTLAEERVPLRVERPLTLRRTFNVPIEWPRPHEIDDETTVTWDADRGTYVTNCAYLRWPEATVAELDPSCLRVRGAMGQFFFPMVW